MNSILDRRQRRSLKALKLKGFMPGKQDWPDVFWRGLAGSIDEHDPTHTGYR